MTDSHLPSPAGDRLTEAGSVGTRRNASDGVPAPRARRGKRYAIGFIALVVLCVCGSLAILVVRNWRIGQALADLPVIDKRTLDPSLAEILDEALHSVEQQPLSGPKWGHYANVLVANDFVAEAVKCYATAERLDANDPRWPYLRGVSLSRLDPHEAVQCYRRAIQLRSNFPLARLRLAMRLLAQGELDDAERQLEAVSDDSPIDARIRVELGRIAMQRGQFERALAYVAQAESPLRGRRYVHELLAQIHQRRGDSAAVQEQLQILETIPQTDVEDIDDQYLADLTRFKRGPEWTAAVAERYIAAGRFDESIAMLERAGGVNAPNVLIIIILGKAYLRSGQPDRAEQVLAQALERDPNQAPVHFELGNLALVRTQWADAIPHYCEAVRLKPDFAVAHYNAGVCQRQLGDSTGAIASFLEACRYMPGNFRAHRDAAELLLDSGRVAEARSHVQMAARIAPQDPDVARLSKRVMSAEFNRSTVEPLNR